jgi:hypothetical protein
VDIAKPDGAGKQQRIDLDSAAAHLLEECRMVLPGIQALFGFQLIAVFSEGFGDKLARGEQQVHFLAICLVALSAGFVMTPAAIHRQTQQRAVSERFIWISSWLLLLSMYPLAAGLSLDLYLIGRVIFETTAPAILCGAALFVVLMLLWIALPRHERRLH